MFLQTGMKKSILLVATFLAFPPSAWSGESEDAGKFRQIFLNEVKSLDSDVNDNELKAIHFIPDEAVVAALGAHTVEQAMKLAGATGLEALAKVSPALPPKLSLNLPAQDLTIVLIPGVFAEFIATHAFEEIFDRPSALRSEFQAKVAAKGATDSVNLIENYRAGLPMAEWSTVRALDQVILMGQIEVGDRLVRVILFETEFSTLESLGDASERAALFNSRLEKYLEITGPQRMAFVGYSRGTILGLEMLAQAHKANRPWVNDVKAMISLSGVVMGSNLADDAYDNRSSPMHKILFGLKETADSLEYRDDGTTLLGEKNRGIVMRNNSRWSDYLAHAASEFFDMNRKKKKSSFVDPVTPLLRLDPRAPIAIGSRMVEKLGLLNPFRDYNLNIDRFRYFVDQLLASVNELTSRSRKEWWSKNELPQSTTYYAITAAMANPDASPLEEFMFLNPLSYAGQSFDDVTLLQNRIDYEVLSNVSLNDSQVSVVQAAFPQKIIASLNAKNAGLKTKFLGIAGTHHWGMALREVNRKIVGQSVNGFPREAMLRALAIQVMIDNP